METLQVLWRILSRWSKCIKLFSHLWLSQIKLCWGTFYTFLCFVTFLFSSISWEPFNWFTSFFYRYSWYCSEGYLTKEIFSIFTFWELFRILSYEILHICSIYYSNSQYTQKNLRHVSLCYGSFDLFWVYSSMSW